MIQFLTFDFANAISSTFAYAPPWLPGVGPTAPSRSKTLATQRYPNILPTMAHKNPSDKPINWFDAGGRRRYSSSREIAFLPDGKPDDLSAADPIDFGRATAIDASRADPSISTRRYLSYYHLSK